MTEVPLYTLLSNQEPITNTVETLLMLTFLLQTFLLAHQYGVTGATVMAGKQLSTAATLLCFEVLSVSCCCLAKLIFK